jgi:hypothetical protein
MKDSNDQSLSAWSPINTSDSVAPMHPSDRRSVFARHPKEFASHLVDTGVPPPTTLALTNTGVRIRAPILPFPPDHECKGWSGGELSTIHEHLTIDPLVLVILDCHFALSNREVSMSPLFANVSTRSACSLFVTTLRDCIDCRPRNSRVHRGWICF